MLGNGGLCERPLQFIQKSVGFDKQTFGLSSERTTEISLYYMETVSEDTVCSEPASKILNFDID